MLQRAVTILCLSFFCLTAPKNLKEEPFRAVFQKNSSSEKLYGYELGGGGGNKVYRRKKFVLKCRKISYLNPSLLCFRKFPVAKKFMDKRGGEREAVSRLSVRSFFISQCREVP